MATAVQNTNSTTIRSILQHEKLIGPNFTNWYQNLRIIIKFEEKLAHLEQPLIPLPLHVAPQVVRDTYESDISWLQTGRWTVSKHLHLKDEGYLDSFECLGYVIPKELDDAETSDVLAIQEGKIQEDKKKPKGAKGKEKGKNKLAYAPKPKIPSPPKRDNLAK
nr:hypothetical protein [Tanacetum cinerariifolium]